MRRQVNPVLPEDFKLNNRTCLVCKKPTQGYGCFSLGYVCSRKCNEAYEKQKFSMIDYQIGERHESNSGNSDGDDDDVGES